MLDADTKRRIDSARDILVGKVPDPKSQVNQITIALIYKFMNDMDVEAEVLGGKRDFFAGEWERYSWPKLMRSGLGGHEVLNLYGEAITRMPENPGIPMLFCDIFKNAFLPYRDPETLKSFLKIIDEFEYDHSERLGDAFEYLLSVLGSQGDAGQFRTPRHIIEFMVKIIDPKKNESVLDPACGTAGFLISAYKHILRNNKDKNDNNTLTPDDRGRLAKNFKGYDISPDMVRLSLVNLYLHGFKDPHIFEYDTLTSDDKWNEYADVILANPPFMSPKGGIKPHKRFSIQAKRSEVLFVDYMAEHLTPAGRAAIIVPEGIIFHGQTAYKQLRKMLVDEYLVAVVSLPSGVFQPYAGVKTSVLIIDKSLARQSNTVAFFKVENDGFGLGAQRRAIEKNDLPQVQTELATYLHSLRTKAPTDELVITTGLIVSKEKIAANGDYNFSGERYRETHTAQYSDYDFKKIDELCTIRTGKKDVNSGNENGKYPFFTCARNHTYSDEYSFDTEAILIAGNGDVGAVQYYSGKFEAYQRTYVLTGWVGVMGRFLYFLLKDRLKETVSMLKLGNTMPYIKLGMLTDFEVPLPPLEIQKEIVSEIEGYQKVIDGARAVLDNYRPHIPIHPDWPMDTFREVTATITPPKKIPAGDFSDVGCYPVIDQSQKMIAGWTDDENTLIDGARGVVIFGDHTCAVKFISERFAQGADGIKIIKSGEQLEPKFVYFYLLSHPIEQDGYKRHFSKLKESRIAIPPLAIQQAIVAEIEAEQALVAANRELIKRMEQKIQTTLACIWGETPEVEVS